MAKNFRLQLRRPVNPSISNNLRHPNALRTSPHKRKRMLCSFDNFQTWAELWISKRNTELPEFLRRESFRFSNFNSCCVQLKELGSWFITWLWIHSKSEAAQGSKSLGYIACITFSLVSFARRSSLMDPGGNRWLSAIKSPQNGRFLHISQRWAFCVSNVLNERTDSIDHQLPWFWIPTWGNCDNEIRAVWKLSIPSRYRGSFANSSRFDNADELTQNRRQFLKGETGNSFTAESKYSSHAKTLKELAFNFTAD